MAASSEPLITASVRSASLRSMRASPKPPSAVSFEPFRSAWARPAPFSLIAPAPMNVASLKSPYDRCAPLRSSCLLSSPSVVSLHATGQLLSPAERCLSISTVQGGAGNGGGCIIAVSPRFSCHGPSCVRLSTNEIAAAVSWIATLRWPAPSHSAGNKAPVEERQRMSAQDSTKRLWTKHPTTGTARVVEVREPRAACTGTRAGNQVSEPSTRMLACSPVCRSPSDFAIIIAMPTNRCQG